MHCRWGALGVAMVLATSACAGSPDRPDSPANQGFDLEAALPLDSRELAQAAKATEAFSAAYETWRFDEGTAAYLGRLSPYVTSDLLSRLAKSASTQDLVVARTMVREVADGHAKVLALRSMSKRELMFTARVDQSVTTSTRKAYTHDYAVWLIKSDVWRVTEVAPVDNAESDALWIAD